MSKTKERLDVLVVEQGLAASRERARALILAGHVTVDGHVVSKAGTAVDRASQIALIARDHPYVGRGGIKVKPDPKTSNNYSDMWTCREQFESGLLHFVMRIRDRRYLVVDEERGLVVAFAFFDHDAGASRHFTTPDGRSVTAGPTVPWTWHIAELFKVEKGQLHEIEAILERAPYGMTSGWSSWEDGMSDEIQFVR